MSGFQLPKRREHAKKPPAPDGPLRKVQAPVWMPRIMRDQLKKAAEEEGVSFSVLAVRILDEWLLLNET